MIFRFDEKAIPTDEFSKGCRSCSIDETGTPEGEKAVGQPAETGWTCMLCYFEMLASGVKKEIGVDCKGIIDYDTFCNALSRCANCRGPLEKRRFSALFGKGAGARKRMIDNTGTGKMKINDLFRENRTLLSFEFFPPKNPESGDILDETVSVLKRFRPDFVSVTYGAGGTTRRGSVDWTFRIKEKYGLNVMMHLTCIASSKEDIHDITAKLRQKGIENILALRGDPPKDYSGDTIKDDFQYAFQLVKYLRDINNFSIGVAGYPEGHIECSSIEKDIEHLKMKVDAGADFIITQLFFENSYFYEFMNRVVQLKIDVPIIPGLMPIVNINQVKKFTDMCGASVPDKIMADMQDRDSADMLKTGVEYAILQCLELLDFGVDGLHFYTLNRNTATEQILTQIEGNIRG